MTFNGIWDLRSQCWQIHDSPNSDWSICHIGTTLRFEVLPIWFIPEMHLLQGVFPCDTPWNAWEPWCPSLERDLCQMWSDKIELGRQSVGWFLGFWAIHPHKFPLWTDGWTRYGPKPSITAARPWVQIFYLHLYGPNWEPFMTQFAEELDDIQGKFFIHWS